MRRFLTALLLVLLAACGEDPVLTPTVPTTITRVGSEIGTPGWRLDAPLTVRVLDNTGAPVANTVVTWSTDEVEAWLGATTSTTDADGVASVPFAPGWRVGGQRVRVTIGTLAADVTVETRAITLAKVALAYSGIGCGLDEAGKVWCFTHASNNDRLHEPRPLPPTLWPVSVDGGNTYREITAVGSGNGERFCGLTASRVLRCWSYAGTPGPVPLAHDVVTPVPFEGISGAMLGFVNDLGSLCGLDSEGAAWCQGANEGGQLGDGTTVSRSTFAQVSGDQRFTRLAAGATAFCGIDTTNLAWCWGRLSNRAMHAVPTRMGGDAAYSAIAFSYYSPCGITLDDRSLRCWWGGQMEGVPAQGTDAVGVPSGGPIREMAGAGPLGVVQWVTGRIGFAGDMAHDMGVNRFVRRPSDLPSESTDFLPPIAGGFTALVSQTSNWWCANHELGATLCSYRVQRPTGIPHP